MTDNLINHYKKLCQDLGQSENGDFLVLLQQSSTQLQAESSLPITTLIDEIQYFSRKLQLLDSNPDPEKKERVTQILTQLTDLQKNLSDPLNHYEDVLRNLDVLRQVQPAYTRTDEIIKKCISIELQESLPLALDKAICEIPILKVSDAVTSSIEIIFGDELFQSLPSQQLDDLKERIKVFQQMLESMQSIKKCIPLTQVSVLFLQKSSFSSSRNVFDEQVKSISDQMILDEQKTAKYILKIIEQLTKENANFVIPSIVSLKGAISRPRIRKYLSTMEGRIADATQAVFESVDDHIITVSQFCSSIQTQSGDSIISQVLKLKSNKMDTQCAYTLAQMFLSDSLFKQVQQQVKLIVEKLKQKEAELIRHSKLFIGQLFSQIKIHKIMEFNDSGNLTVFFPDTLKTLIRLTTGLQGIGYDFKQLGLPNDLIATVETMLACTSAIEQLKYVAQFYNSLNTLVKAYQKPILLKSAGIYEQELKKCCEQTNMLISTNGIKDPQYIQKLQKVGTYAENVTDEFRLRIEKLEEFHNSQLENFRILQNTNLSKMQAWNEIMSKIQLDFDNFLKIIPADMQASLIIYWSGGLIKVLASKYKQIVGSSLANLRQLNQTIVVNQDMQLEPNPFQVQTFLIEQISKISRIPMDDKYKIYSQEYIKACKIGKLQQFIQEMYDPILELSVQYIPEAMDNIQQVFTNLLHLQNYLISNCSIISLNLENNEAEMAKKLISFENCKQLFEIAKNTRDEAVDLKIKHELKFLEEKQDEPNVFVIKPSGGCVKIDLQTVLRLYSMKKQAMKEVALKACCAIGDQNTQVISSSLIVFKNKLKESLAKAKSSEEFRTLVSSIDSISKDLKNELEAKVDELRKIVDFVNAISEYKDRADIMKKAVLEYETLINELSNISGTLEQKKKEMFENNRKELVNIVQSMANISGLVQSQFEQLNLFLEQVVMVQPLSDSPDNNVYLRCSLQGSYKSENILPQIISKYSEFDKLQEKLTVIDQEFVILSNQHYVEFMSVQQQQVLRKSISKLTQYKQLIQIFSKLGTIHNQVCNIVKQEFMILKQSLQSVDELTKIVQQQNSELNDEEAKIQIEDADDALFTKSLIQNLRRYQIFQIKLFNQFQNLVKQLKSPALQKQHWQELQEKIQFIQITKMLMQQQILAQQVPELLSGATLLYPIAFYMFQSLQNILSDSLSSEYKRLMGQVRDIIQRAEGELAVRVAVEEVTAWLKNEAIVGFNLQELSQVSIDELISVKKISSIPLTAQWKPFLVQLTEKKAVLVSVSQNQWAKSLKAEIDIASQKIEAGTRIAYVMTQIARQITILEPVMGRKVLANEHSKFYSALKLFCFLIISCINEKDCSALQKQEGTIQLPIIDLLSKTYPDSMRVKMVKQDNVDNSGLGVFINIVLSFESISALFSEVQLALRQYLEEKRLAFSRFYFVGDADVLEILANANTKPVQTLQPHIKKLFSAIERLEIVQKGDIFAITSFVSSEGEIVKLKTQVLISQQIPPELWLNRLSLQIKETLKSELCEVLNLPYQAKDSNKLQLGDNWDACDSYQRVKAQISPYTPSNEFFAIGDLQNFSLDPQKVSGEVFTIACALQFAASVDKDPNSQENLTQVLEYQEKLLKQFSTQLFTQEIANASFGSQQYVVQLKLRAITTDVTHHIDVLKSMIADKLNRRWLWNREMKPRMYRQQCDVYLVGLDTFLPYSFEYQGLYQRLIHTPLTTRCYSTLISALATSKSSNPQGPAGTGKTESVKAFSAKIARPCIVFNCDSAIDREDLGRILIGIVLSGAVGCFDEVNRLSPAVLSAVSTDIENIQRSINRRQTTQNVAELANETLTLSGITIPISRVSPYAAVFVTMNPASREYRGRSELPFSLLKLLRGCFMGKADVAQIMETVLSTSGFTFAGIWAAKSDIVYQLASRRIPKEVHLDWGLRSLQSVLRQAALSRASISRKGAITNVEMMEKGVIIKALSDATFSRVQNQSATIFKEILIDVFGQQAETTKQRFGSTNDVELQFANNIQSENEKVGQLVLQFYRALTTKLGVALLGKAASGKTTIRELFKMALKKATNGKIEVKEYLISAKSMSRQDLLGYVDPTTKEWNDGALTRAARQAVQILGQQSPAIWPIIVFDGEIDPNWIEALNSSLDDNRLLSLSSGERIRFPMSLDPLDSLMSGAKHISTPISFVFETDSLQHASPASVSRLAVILVADKTTAEQIPEIQLKSEIVGKIVSDLVEISSQDRPLQELTTHLILASVGEKDPVVSVLRALNSETLLSDQKQLDLSNKMGSQIVLQGSEVDPQHCESSSLPSQQQWATRLILQLLNNNAPIMISGPQQSAKFHCLYHACNLKDQYQVIPICCTALTSREQIIQIIQSNCVEYQRVDGEKEIRPRSGKKIVLVLRNADVGKLDEYKHSEIFTLLWSLVSHKKLYLKQGISVEMKNILICITVSKEELVPQRLRRIMGIVRLQDVSQADSDIILGSFAKQQHQFRNLKSYYQWLSTCVSSQETTKLKNKIQGLYDVVAIPQLLINLKNIKFSNLIQFSNQKLSQDQVAMLYSYYLECQIPFADGRTAYNEDVKQFVKQNLDDMMITYQKAGVTAQSQQRSLQQNEAPTYHVVKAETVTIKVRLNLLKELCAAVSETFPGLRMFHQVLQISSVKEQQYYLKQIASIENNLQTQSGILLLSQPNLFSAESFLIACLSSQYDVSFVGCEIVSSLSIRSLIDKFLSGFKKIAFVIDTSTIECDETWISVASAFASQDTYYIKSLLSTADFRSIISKYQEIVEVKDMSEEKLMEQLFTQFIICTKPILFVNPESCITDKIIEISPPIRRGFGIVSFCIDNSYKDQVVQASLKQLNINCDPSKNNAVEYYKKYRLSEQQPPVNSKLRILIIQKLLQQKWQIILDQKQEKLSMGLQQLSAAEKEVEFLSKEAQKRLIQVEKAQTDANDALKQITIKMETVQENKSKAKLLEKTLKAQEGTIFEQKEQAEVELSQVKPLLDDAKNAVSNIPNDAMSEVKSFKAPPPAVEIVLAAVVMFMGMRDPSWNGIKSFISQNGFLSKIVSLDVSTVNPQIFKAVQKYVAENAASFEQSTIQRVSKAAAPLAKWVTANLAYVDIYTRIEPLMKKCEEANINLTSLRSNLKQINDQVAQLEMDAAELQKVFKQKSVDLAKYQQELEAIDVKKRKGEQMLSQLSGEKLRWTENEKRSSNMLQNLESFSLDASSLFILTGNQTDDIRQEFIKSRDIISQLMITPLIQDQFQKLGLRISQQALENAALLDYLEGSPFSTVVLSNVTESTGVMKFLKNKYSPQFVTASSENLSNLVSIAARFGQTVVITECDQGYIPYPLIPYLRYGFECYKVADSSSINFDAQFGLIKVDAVVSIPASAAKICEMNSKFRMIIVSSVMITVPSHLQANLVELSFAPTNKSRTDLYMDKVLSVWSPDTLTKIQQLQVAQADLRFQLSEIEDSLLQALKLSKQSKNILDDQNLNSSLQKAEQQNIQIEVTIKELQKADNELKELKSKATDIATVVSQSMQALEAIMNLNELYTIDDSAVLPILDDILQENKIFQTPQEKITNEMVTNTNFKFLQQMYQRIQTMVFADDKVASLTLFLRYCKPTIFTHKLLMYFTGKEMESQVPPPSWAGEFGARIQQVMEALGTDVITQIKMDQPQMWSGYVNKLTNAKDVNYSLLPDQAQQLNSLQKIALLSAIRPDLISQLLMQVCEEAFSAGSSVSPIQQALKLVSPIIQPIIIYTAAGQDPTSSLNADIIAMAPGKELDAEKQLDVLMEKNIDKIVIKGAHLCLNWLQVLPFKLQELKSKYPAKKLTIILLLEPKPGFPRGLSRIAWRFCLQQSSSARQTMLQILREVQVPSSSPLAPFYLASIFIIAALHTVMESRRVYAPRGVAADPGWNSQDAITLSEIFSKFAKFTSDPTMIVERVRGYFADAVYGVQTKDVCDSKLAVSLVELAFNKQAVDIIKAACEKQSKPSADVQQNFQNFQAASEFVGLCDRFPVLKLCIPPLDCLTQQPAQIMASFQQYVQRVFQDKHSPDQLCLPASALLTKGDRDSLLLKQLLVRAQSYQQASGKTSDVYAAALKLHEQFGAQTAEISATFKQIKKFQPTKTKPLAEELISQLQMLQKLLKIIQQDLEELKSASADALTAPQRSKQIAQLLSQNVVPETWSTGIQAPPCSTAPLQNPEFATLSNGTPSDFIKFLARAAQSLLQAYNSCEQAEHKADSISIELASVLSPGAVLEAVRRYEGVCQQLELDAVKLYAVVGARTQSRYPIVQISSGQTLMKGAAVGAGLDFNQPGGQLPIISIVVQKPTGVEIPLYVERGREVRMPVVDAIFVETGAAMVETTVILFGVYAHLNGR